MSRGAIPALAGYEFRASIRNRWFLLYALAFAGLAVALSALSLSGAGMLGFAGFGRTAAALINLVLLIVPLMGLTIGAQSLAGERERGTLAYLLAQPIGRGEVLLGKFAGLTAALLTALIAGFGLSAAVIAWQGGVVDAGQFLVLIGFALLLATASLSLGLLVSAFSRTSALGVGMALFTWLAFVFAGDLGLMGSAIVMKVRIQSLLAVALLNPLQLFKIGAVGALRSSLEILGPAGIYATRTFGAALPLLLGAALILWIIIPLGAAYLRFRTESDL